MYQDQSTIDFRTEQIQENNKGKSNFKTNGPLFTYQITNNKSTLSSLFEAAIIDSPINTQQKSLFTTELPQKNTNWARLWPVISIIMNPLNPSYND